MKIDDIKGLEPGHNYTGDAADNALISIAISLKRIADMMEHEKSKMSVEYNVGLAAMRKSHTP